MPHLINLIQNSAKVMASSGIVAIRFLIENTPKTRLIPPIASGISSRSKEILVIFKSIITNLGNLSFRKACSVNTNMH